MCLRILHTSKFSTLHFDHQALGDRSDVITDCSSTGYVWLSKRLLEVTNGSEHIVFDGPLLAVMEDDIKKCRDTRLHFQTLDSQKCGYRVLTDVCDESFRLFAAELDVNFDIIKYPLRESFATMMGKSTEDLALLHQRYSQDKGRLKDRHEKRTLLQSILDPIRRKPFHFNFVDFVLNFIAPHVKSVTRSRRIYFQSFPCIRVVRPGEFSIGPHCDASYGFSQANINFYVPLTKIFGTNSLILESSPGLEDWHTIELEYGSLKRFYGSQCSHFTAENTTDQTRISLDFRVIPEEYWIEDHDHFTSTPGYYTSCKFVPSSSAANERETTPKNSNQFDCQQENTVSDSATKNSDVKCDRVKAGKPEIASNTEIGYWVLEGEILDPDWRVGFPFEKLVTKKNNLVK